MMHSRCLSLRFPIDTLGALLGVAVSRGGISGMTIPEAKREFGCSSATAGPIVPVKVLSKSEEVELQYKPIKSKTALRSPLKFNREVETCDHFQPEEVAVL
ncbi:unnamed protein product [Phytophthora lilii]|uniref:Unnamed protein product n=1 Tax=Phytophthora lilii TaxID=2077276 RepID=A0A9W7CNQ2_9STRA|nr:unnamed protein product [Phytophthora lilii]